MATLTAAATQITRNRAHVLEIFEEPLAGKLLGRELTLAEAKSESFQNQLISTIARQFLRYDDVKKCHQLDKAGQNIYLELLGGSPIGVLPRDNFDSYQAFLKRMGQKVVYVYTPCDTTPSAVLFLTSQYASGGFHRFGLTTSEVDLLAKKSDLFRSTFQGQKSGEFQLGMVHIHELIELLKALSTHLSINSLQDLVKYLKMAEKFQVPSLQEACLNYLDKYLAESEMNGIFVDDLAKLFAELENFGAFKVIEAERRVREFLIKNQDNPTFRKHLNDFHKSFFKGKRRLNSRLIKRFRTCLTVSHGGATTGSLL